MYVKLIYFFPGHMFFSYVCALYRSYKDDDDDDDDEAAYFFGKSRSGQRIGCAILI